MIPECPSCRKPIAAGAQNCVHCGENLEVQQSLFWVKQELKRAEDQATLVRGSLAQIGQRVESLDGLVAARLRKTVPPDVQPYSVRQESPAVTPQDLVVSAPEETDLRKELVAVLSKPAPKPEPKESPSPPPRPIPPPRTRKATQSEQEAELMVGQKWLLVVGVVAVVAGMAYFLKYSIEQGWLSPTLRLLMAYAAGGAFILGGDHFRRADMRKFGLPLAGGGIAILYAATYAGMNLYGLFSDTVGFALMVLVTLGAGGLALLHDSRSLATLGIIGGFLTPVLVPTETPSQIGLMSYMAFLNGGVVWLAFFKRWNLLTVLGFLSTWLLYGTWFWDGYRSSPFVLSMFFQHIFFLTYAIAPFAYAMREGRDVEGKDFLVVFPNSLISLAFAGALIDYHLAYSEYTGIITVLYAALYGGMAAYFKSTFPLAERYFVLLACLASLFLILTVPIVFSEHWLTTFWAIESAILLYAGVRFQMKPMTFGSLLLMAGTTALFVLHDLPEVFDVELDPLRIEAGYLFLAAARWITTIAVMVGLSWFGICLRGKGKELVGGEPELGTTFLVAAGLGIWGALTLEVSAAFHEYWPDMRVAAISVAWTLFAGVLMAEGFAKRHRPARQASLVVFLVTALKVLLQDTAHLATPYRVLSFMVLGVVLIAASYLYHRFAERVRELDAPQA